MFKWQDLGDTQGQTFIEIAGFVADWAIGHILDADVKCIECLVKGDA